MKEIFVTTTLDNYYTSGFNHYIYLLHLSEIPDAAFYVYDLEENNLQYVEMKLDNSEKVVTSIFADEYGNVIIRFNDIDCKNGNSRKPSYYYFTREEIEKYILENKRPA